MPYQTPPNPHHNSQWTEAFQALLQSHLSLMSLLENKTAFDQILTEKELSELEQTGNAFHLQCLFSRNTRHQDGKSFML